MTTITTPRKLPGQARARATVDTLMEATAQILAKEGLQALTTNRVAARAGVSIGSLYQYFPNKSALIAALMERHVADELKVLGSRIESLWDAPLAELIQQLIAAHVQLHQANLKLTRALHAEVPRLGISSVLCDASRTIEERLLTLLETRPERFAPRNLRLAVFLIVNGVETLNERFLLERQEFCPEEVVSELSAMVLRYLDPQH